MALVQVHQDLIIDTEELRTFIREAKLVTYASDKENPLVTRQESPLSTIIRYKRADARSHWSYSDEYKGSYAASGEEVVWFDDIPVWSMAYYGGMISDNWGSREFAKKTFCFLKEALRHVSEDHPYRGPSLYKGEDPGIFYHNEWKGNITKFHGKEWIIYRSIIFEQRYIGGLIAHQF